jgi:integrase
MAVGRETPRTDRGWQAYLTSVRPPAERAPLGLGGSLQVLLEPSGIKTFYARLRRQGDKNPRTIRVGTFPAISVAEARQRVSDMKSQAREGLDPALEQRRTRAGTSDIHSLSVLVEAYLARRAGDVAPKTLRIESELLRGTLVPALGDRLLADLGPGDFGAVLSSYAARLRKGGTSGSNANKLLKAARQMFKLARGWGLITVADPTQGLTRPVKEAPRDRVLFDGQVLVGPDARTNEIGALMGALNAKPRPVQISDATRVALLLAILFGFRASEVCALEWRGVSLDREVPTISVTKSKTKAGQRTLPVPPNARELLREHQGRSRGGEKFLFPAEDGARRTEHLHPESLSRAFARACARLGIDGAVLHDLRRTALSGIIELGHGAVAERIAGHAATSVIGRHYDRSDRIQAMALALSDWSDAIRWAEEHHHRSEVADGV